MTFSTVAIGKKISNLRKEKNLTQMELADAMGVSYQAVSNWERGNSMPDISKLPELATLFGCSIDDLLTDGEAKNIIKHVVKGDAEVFVQQHKVSGQAIGEVAPILKPHQTERLMDSIISQNEEKMTVEDLIGIAPFVGEGYLDQIVDKIDAVENMEAIQGIAPFLSEESLDKLLRKCVLNGNMRQIVGLAPFLKEETLDFLVTDALEKGDVSGCHGLYPFLSKETLHKLADTLVKKHGFKAIRDLAPFL
ncbi:MAG: helix-turn-helix transcriptional regulator [Mobilitalea sp.]